MCIIRVVSGPAEFGRPGGHWVAELFSCKLALLLLYEYCKELTTVAGWETILQRGDYDAGWETITDWKAEAIVESSVDVIKALPDS